MVPLCTFLSLASLSAFATPSLVLASPASQASTERVVLDRGFYTAQNGHRFSFVKEQVADQVIVTFRNGDRVLDRAGMRRYEAEHPAPKIDPGLLTSAETAPEVDLRLLVWLEHQPAARIARATHSAYRAELESLSAEVRSLQQSLRPSIVGSRDDQADLDLLVTGLGGHVARRIPSANAATIVLPAASLAHLAVDPHVARIEALNRATPELDLQRESLGLDEASGFWADGFAGATYDAGVLDTSVQQDHPALGHLRFESTIGTTDTDGHGTAITGIIASNDANPGLGCRNFGLFCGMAWGMDALLAGSSDACVLERAMGRPDVRLASGRWPLVRRGHAAGLQRPTGPLGRR